MSFLKKILLKRILFFSVGLLIILGVFFLSIFSNYLHDYFEVKQMDIPIEQSLMSDWVINLPDKIISTPVIEGNHLYIQTSSSILSYDLQTHKMIWESTIKGNVRNCPPVIIKNYIFAADEDEVIALDSDTGKILWRSQFIGKNLIFGDLEVSNSRVFVATYNDYFYSLDMNDGRVIWKAQVEPRSGLRIFPHGSNIIIDSSSFISSYNQISGIEVWKKQIRFENGILLSDQKTLIGMNYDDDSSRIIGIDLSTGEILFSNPIQVQKVNCIVESEKGLLLAGEDLTLYNLEANEIIWKDQQVSNLGCPVVFEKYAYVKKELRDIYKYDILTGIIQTQIPISWESSLKSSYSIASIVYKDWLIIETSSRRIEFFRQ